MASSARHTPEAMDALLHAVSLFHFIYFTFHPNIYETAGDCFA